MECSEAGTGILPKCSLLWGAALLGFVQEQIGMQTPRDYVQTLVKVSTLSGIRFYEDENEAFSETNPKKRVQHPCALSS